MAGNRHFGPEMDKVSGKVSYGACRRPGLFLYRRSLSALRLSVRTPPFHGGERGSIPLGRARLSSLTFSVGWQQVSCLCAIAWRACSGWQERGLARARWPRRHSICPLRPRARLPSGVPFPLLRYGRPLRRPSGTRAGNTDAPGRGRGASGRAGRFWAALRLWGMGNQRRSCFRRATSG